jgi:uncharacterized BrkB/YihY/UPF0761 family membrane protein
MLNRPLPQTVLTRIIALLLLIFAAICLGFFALIFGLIWIYTAKTNPNSLWKVNHSASVIKDAVLAIFGVFAFLIFLSFLSLVFDAVAHMLK